MKLNAIKPILFSAVLFTFVACGGSAKSTESLQQVTQTTTDPCAGNVCGTNVCGTNVANPCGATAGSVPSAQIDKGKSLWADECSICHGDDGEGNGKALPIMGEGTLSQFANALELHKYIMESMPKTDPGSLSSEDSAAVTAWILQKRGITLNAPLTDTNAAQLKL